MHDGSDVLVDATRLPVGGLSVDRCSRKLSEEHIITVSRKGN
jgi:hypothetical protein